MSLSKFFTTVAGLIFLSLKVATADTPIRLGTNIWPGYEPFYLARELKYFEENTVSLVEYQSATEVMRAFRNNSIEAAALTLDEVLTLLQFQVSVQIILIIDISNGADAIVAKPPISNLLQLTGRRVGVEGTALGAYIFSRALDKSGIAINNVRTVQLDVNEHEAAYRSGKIDAVVTFEPIRTKLINAGAKELFTSREIPGEIVDVLIVRQQDLETHKTKIKELVDTWFAALKFFKHDPNTAAKLMSKRLGISPTEVLTSFQGLEMPDVEKNRRLLSGVSPPLTSVAKRLRKVMLENKLLNKPVNVDQLVTPILFQ